MPEYPWPDWMKSSIDQRFNELARIASLQDEVKSIRQKQELEPQVYQIVLEWEEVMNYWNATEKEWMYISERSKI